MLPKHFLTDESPLQTGDAVAAIIVVEDGRYLLQLRDDIPRIFYPGFWGCFGGAVSPSEEPVAALKRELQEELEFEPKDCAQILSLDFDLHGINGKKHYRHYYLMTTTQAESCRFVLHEGAAKRLFTPEQIFSLPNVTPYDSFAVWLHCARARLAEKSVLSL
jgi:8-oxo-dGTP pyrophosphatase MutT (NUDIX family)